MQSPSDRQSTGTLVVIQCRSDPRRRVCAFCNHALMALPYFCTSDFAKALAIPFQATQSFERFRVSSTPCLASKSLGRTLSTFSTTEPLLVFVADSEAMPTQSLSSSPLSS